MESKTLYRSKWLALNTTDDGYEFVSENRGEVSVAVLPYHMTKTGELFVLSRYERCPAHGDVEEEMCALTGTVETGAGLVDTVVQEVYEESGYAIHESQVRKIAEVFPSKASNHKVSQFAVKMENLTDADFRTSHSGPGDGSPLEMGTYCIWHRFDDVFSSADPILHSMAAAIRVVILQW